jgi:hypothetical protein
LSSSLRQQLGVGTDWWDVCLLPAIFTHAALLDIYIWKLSIAEKRFNNALKIFENGYVSTSSLSRTATRPKKERRKNNSNIFRTAYWWVLWLIGWAPDFLSRAHAADLLQSTPPLFHLNNCSSGKTRHSLLLELFYF